MQATKSSIAIIKNIFNYLSSNTSINLGMTQDEYVYLQFILDGMLKSKSNNNSLSINEKQISFIEDMSFNKKVDSDIRFKLTNLLSIIRSPKTTVGIESFIDEDSNYNESAINGKIKQLEKRQITLLSQLDDMSNQNKKIFSDYERKLTLLFNKKIEEADTFFSEKTRADIDRINKHGADITEVINNAQHAISSKVHESEKNLINSINVAQLHARTEFSDLKDDTLIEINKRIKSEISFFVNANKQLNKLLSAASNGVLARDNLAQAERERKTADWLRGLGVFFLSCAVVYIACEIIGMMKDISNVSIENVMIRVVITFILMLPSIYLLKESSRHRADERKFRKTGINLATIDSYLANFDDSSKVDIKRQLTANFFDNNEQIVDYSTVPDIQAIVEKTIDRLMPNKKEAENDSNVTQPKDKTVTPK